MAETEMLKEPRIIVAKVAHVDQASRTGEQFDTRRKANYGPDSTACCTWTPNQVVLPHPGGPTTRYSAASVSVFFTDGIVFSLLHAGFSSRLSVENSLDPLYM